ncbi:MAG: monovalent cation/H+ antiporter subunit D family protein [Candidatus Schekmanbacteria bacterium]|nr:monovalent cation/H+ antiporter subunit D family protein [Candidatus Schekmanbacteria bacterium]
MFDANMLPFWAVLLPVFSTIAIPFLSDKNRHYYTSLVTFITLIIVSSMYHFILQGQQLQQVITTGLGFNFIFRVDALGFLVGIISIILWFLAAIYGVEYLRDTHSLGRYNMFSLFSLSGMLGVVFTGNLFSLYIFFELLSIGSAILVFHEETPEAMRAGFKYLFLGISGGLVLLFAIIATYQITGHGDLNTLGVGLKESRWLPYIFWGYIIGFGVKAGMVPVHIWLPSAHPVAPSPASALLSGIMIKAGAYGIFRTVYSIVGSESIIGLHSNLTLILLILSLITIFLGSAVAITQVEIKRMLAYSSISQIGYVIMGIALISHKAMMGSLMHIFGHALMKGALFLCAGAIIHQTGLRQIKDLRGLGQRMPLTMTVFTIGALSMIGIPPMVGFVSKWYLALGALDVMDKHIYWPGWGVISLVMLLISSLLNLIYYGPIIIGAWFSPQSETTAHSTGHGNPHHSSGQEIAGAARTTDDPNLWMMLPLIVLGFSVLFFGIFPGFPLDLAGMVSKVFLP